MRCVVCRNQVVGLPIFANAWERTRKKSPCCSEACASRFDIDVHWIPEPPPAPASDAEEGRLLNVVRRRLRDGDRPKVVIREMLCAGLSTGGLRKLLRDAQLGHELRARQGRAAAVLGFLSGAFARPATERRDASSLEAALAELDAWEARA